MESAKKIRDALGIEREAVGVKYTDESPAAKLAELTNRALASVESVTENLQLLPVQDGFDAKTTRDNVQHHNKRIER